MFLQFYNLKFFSESKNIPKVYFLINCFGEGKYRPKIQNNTPHRTEQILKWIIISFCLFDNFGGEVGDHYLTWMDILVCWCGMDRRKYRMEIKWREYLSSLVNMSVGLIIPSMKYTVIIPEDWSSWTEFSCIVRWRRPLLVRVWDQSTHSFQLEGCDHRLGVWSTNGEIIWNFDWPPYFNPPEFIRKKRRFQPTSFHAYHSAPVTFENTILNLTPIWCRFHQGT